MFIVVQKKKKAHVLFLFTKAKESPLPTPLLLFFSNFCHVFIHKNTLRYFADLNFQSVLKMSVGTGRGIGLRVGPRSQVSVVMVEVCFYIHTLFSAIFTLSNSDLLHLVFEKKKIYI